MPILKTKIKIKESDIQKGILEYLLYCGIYCWRNNSNAVYDPVRKVFRKQKAKYYINGVADILGIYRGKFLAIEVKTDKGIVSDDQTLFLNNINKNGGIGFVARSLDDVRKKFKEVGIL